MSDALLRAISALPDWNVSLFMMLAKATIILITALGITLAMQRTSAGARHLVWLVTLGALLLVPALTAWAPLRLKVLPAESTSAYVAGVPDAQPALNAVPRAVTGIEQSGPVADGNANLTRDTAVPSMSTRLLASLSDMSAISMLVAAWLLVAAAIGVSLAWASFAVRRIVRNAAPLDTQDWSTPLWEVADRMGLDEVPRLLRSEEAKMPFACGLTTPTIVLPAESDSWTLDRRRAVLLHELAHVRRHDLLGHTLGRLVCAVYWFHPLVWTAAKQLRNESERACDDLALSCGTRATDYAEHLLDIVTSVRRDATPSVALAMARRKEFEGRMLAILDPELRRSTPSRRQSAVLISTLALVALTVGAAAPVPRDAIVVAAAPAAPASEPLPIAPAAPVAAQAPAQQPAATPRAYPDSGERGVMSKDVRTSVSMETATATATATSPIRFKEALIDGAVRLGMKAGVDAAAEALASPEVVNALGSKVSSITVSQLRAIVSDKNARTDDRPALLAKVLRSDSSASLRRIAAWGLSEYADAPVAAEALANAVRRDASESVREMAAWALGNGDDESSVGVAALSAALKSDASDKVRATSAWALGNIGDRSSVDGLIAGLSDKSPSVRSRAIWALGNVEPRTAPSALVAMLKDEDAKVRRMTAWALYQIEDAATAPALEAALRAEQNKDVQLDYIRALAAMGEKSVDAIKGLLESPDPRIKTMAVKALAGGHASGPWPMPWPEPRPFP